MDSQTLIIILASAVGVGFVLSLAGTAVAIPFAKRINYVDKPGAHKSHVKVTPYGGGLAIFFATWVPLIIAVVSTFFINKEWIATHIGEFAAPYFGGLIARRGQAITILVGGLILHVMGFIDDKRPLGAIPKLLVMIGVAVLVTTVGQVRLGEAIVGPIPAIVVSCLWLVVLFNAMNFLDNMDGLSAGIGVICLGTLAACGALADQVHVPALACIFMGGILGFLVFNFPPAKIFMGDAGSLLVGYMVGVTSIMTTYYESAHSSHPPYALAMPLVILAIPLYDFVSVMIIRISEGRHPMQGDQRHFSHRLVDHGLSRRNAVLTIYICTAATGLSATLLPGAGLRETITILVFVLLVLSIIAILESPVRKTP